jgi:hypothetical protein
MAGIKIEFSNKFFDRVWGCGRCGRCGGVGSLLTFDIPQTALVATLDTYDFIIIDGRVIAAYSRGQIVLPKSNMLDETRRGEAEAI